MNQLIPDSDSDIYLSEDKKHNILELHSFLGVTWLDVNEQKALLKYLQDKFGSTIEDGKK